MKIKKSARYSLNSIILLHLAKKALVKIEIGIETEIEIETAKTEIEKVRIIFLKIAILETLEPNLNALFEMKRAM